MSKYVIYLLHFERPVGRSRHYIGSTLPHGLRARLKRHRAGTASALTAEAVKRGIAMRLAYIWPADDRAREQEIKRNKRMNNLCPYCRAEQRGQPFPPAAEVPRCAPGVTPLSWSS